MTSTHHSFESHDLDRRPSASDPTVCVLLGRPDGTGAQRMLELYCTAMVDDGIAVCLIYCPTVDGKPLPEPGVTSLRRLADLGVSLTPVAGLRGGLGVRQFKAVLRACESADVLVAFNQADRKIASVVGILKPKIGVVFQVGNLHQFHGPRLIRFLKRKAYVGLSRRADALVASSDAVEREMADTLGLSRNVSVIHNTIDVTNYPRSGDQNGARSATNLRLDDGQIAALTVGRIQRQKGQDLLLRACSSTALEQLAVMVAGKALPDLEPGYCREVTSAAGLNPNVQMLGWRDDVPTLLAAADFYVHPSRWDGFPLAVIEAMAAGRPVVMSDCVGRPPGFRDGVHGYVVESENVDDLRRALEEMIASGRDRLEQMGAACRSLALANYDSATAGSQFCSIIHKAADAHA